MLTRRIVGPGGAPLAPQTAQPVGMFDSRGDIGVTPKTGSVQYNAENGEYRVTGGGANIWAAEDAYYFVWKRVTGDVTITADVRLIGAGAVAHRKAVLMVRQDLTPGSAYAEVAKPDGSGAKLLTPVANASYFHGWSPDGRWLAFVGQRGGKFELFRVPVTGGAEERLTSKGAYDDGPEYTPDGKWIYFNSNRAGGWDIWRMPVDGAGPGDATIEQVTNDALEDWFPHFSPNGKSMLVFSFPKGTTNHNDKMDGVTLRVMPVPGKTLKPAMFDRLVTFFGGQGTINVNSWSPDSKKFALVVYEPLPRTPQ
ncbi:MAG: hypothetical protein ABI877_10100 [Gemmatimonadaceae bacterium]